MNVMKNAWEIAKEGAVKFGGSAKEYFSEALRLAWAMIKQSKVTVQTLKAEIQAVYGAGYAHRDVSINFKEWKKGTDELHRLYINIEDNRAGALNAVYITLKDNKVHFNGKNATFKAFGSKVADIVTKHQQFIIAKFVA
ncbi:hypothetical protein V2H29_00775 [Lysinibacillus fusiformis]|uniref:hypothetical protein n=1 Tax=Lysinibacillus fusiformis TaxID=28031 RepID=UPI002E9FBEAD|nr:hypothetical protein [Lysinibacillus fusiformis]